MDKKISDLMNYVDIEALEQIELEEYKLTDMELKRIHRKVVDEYKRQVPRRKKFSYKILLVAAILALSGTALYALNTNLFDQIFKQNEKNLGESGQVIELSNQAKNMKVSLRGVVGYEKRLTMLVEVEKIDGTPFEGNTIKLDGCLKVEEKGKSAEYGLNTHIVEGESTETKKVLSIDILNDNKSNIVLTYDEKGKSVIKDLGRVEDFTNKKAVLEIANIIEVHCSDDEPDIDVLQYIDKEAEKNSLPFNDKFYELGMRYTNKQGIEISQPKRMLPYRKRNVALYNRNSKIRLDNIGFIDGKLHIRLYGDFTSKEDYKELRPLCHESYLLAPKDHINWVKYGNHDDFKKTKYLEEYYVFDIKNVEEMKEHPFIANIYQVCKENQLDLQMPFDLDITTKSKEIQTSQTVPASQNNVEWKIESIALSNVALNIELQSIDKATGKERAHIYKDKAIVSENIKLILKDGTEIACKGHDFGTWEMNDENLQDSCFGINIFFMEAIDATQVESIDIEGVNIPVK